MDVLIRRYGNLIDVGPADGRPLPGELLQLLDPPLSYLYKQLLRGAAQYDATTGHRTSMRTEMRHMYRIDHGRLATGAGFYGKIHEILTKAGCRVLYQDVTPTHVRENRFNLHPMAIENIVRYRARQAECVEAMDKNWGGVIWAPTGFGKTTLIGAMAIRYPRATCHVVVKQVSVAHRIRRHLTRLLPNVGMVGDGQDNWGRVTVITADSLQKSDGDADFLFADECHQLVTDNYAETLAERYQFSRNYGFSATPFSRLDGSHARLEGFFGPVIFKMSYQEAVQLGLVVQCFVDWLHCRMPENPCSNKKNPVSKKRAGLWRNTFRNQLFADRLRQYDDNTQCLALVETVEHAVYLWQHLKDYALCYGSMKPEDYHAYKRTGLLPQNFIDVSPEVRYNMQIAFERGELKKVIATDVWATGVDFEQLRVVARLDGRDSEVLDTQGPGRASRTHADSGKQYGEIIDSIDFFDTQCQAKSRGRFKTYDSLGWEQNWPVGRRQFQQATLFANNRENR